MNEEPAKRRITLTREEFYLTTSVVRARLTKRTLGPYVYANSDESGGVNASIQQVATEHDLFF